MKCKDAWKVSIRVDASTSRCGEEETIVVTEKAADAIIEAVKAAVDDERIIDTSLFVEIKASQVYVLMKK